jgi:predicted dehydrogenase
MARPRTVAVIGVGHYHSTWYPTYLQLLVDQRLDIVGIHDPNSAVAEDRANRYNSTPYIDYRRMIEETRPDFVLSLGRHVDMPEAFRFLVETGLPFLMEKPWATDEPTLRDLVALAESRGTWVAAPFPMRYTYWAEKARELVRSGVTGPVSHALYRMVRPGVQRYLDQGCPWMLSQEEAGGGVLINLGCHGFDLCHYILGEDAEVVSAVTSNAACGLEIEDYAFVTMRTKSGALFHNEVGYTIPSQDGGDGEQRLVAAKALVRGTLSGVEIMWPDRTETMDQPSGIMRGWDRVVAECLTSLERGEGPPINARECYRAIAPVFEAYRLAGLPVTSGSKPA